MDIFSLLAGSSVTSAAADALLKAIKEYFAKEERVLPSEVFIESRQLTRAEAIKQIQKFSQLLTDETPEAESQLTKEVISRQISILERERNRLTPIAAREHWIAQIFIIIAGLVFFLGVGLLIYGTVAKAIISMVATSIPGFLSKVYFTREDKMEKRINDISNDLRESERAKERLEILDEVLKAIPQEYRETVIKEVLHKSTVKKVPATNKRLQSTDQN